MFFRRVRPAMSGGPDCAVVAPHGVHRVGEGGDRRVVPIDDLAALHQRRLNPRGQAGADPGCRVSAAAVLAAIQELMILGVYPEPS